MKNDSFHDSFHSPFSVLHLGVALLRSCVVWELRCVRVAWVCFCMGVALSGVCGVGESRCEGVAVCGSFGVWELRSVGVEGY